MEKTLPKVVFALCTLSTSGLSLLSVVCVAAAMLKPICVVPVPKASRTVLNVRAFGEIHRELNDSCRFHWLSIFKPPGPQSPWSWCL